MVMRLSEIWRRSWRVLCYLLVFLIVFYLFYYQFLPAIWSLISFVAPLILPFLLAIFLATAVNPLVDFLAARLRFPRSLAAVTGITLVLGLGVWLLVVMISQLVVELGALSADLPRYASQLKDFLSQAEALYLRFELPAGAQDALQGGVDSLVGLLADLSRRTVSWLVTWLGTVPGFFLMLLITIIATFYFSRDRKAIWTSARAALPPAWAARVEAAGQEIGVSLLGYLRAEILLISVTGLQVLAGLLILDINYAVTISIVSALLDILPVVGPGTIFVPWAVWHLALGNYSLGLALGILYVITVIVRYILEPRVLGRNLGLHPLTTLAAIYVGLKTLGPWGVIIGPLVVIVIKSSWQAGFFRRER